MHPRKDEHFTLMTPLRDYYLSDKGKVRKRETGAGMWTQAADS